MWDESRNRHKILIFSVFNAPGGGQSHDFPNHWTQQQYLPDSLVGTVYYEYGPNKLEQAAKRYWQEIKKP